MDYEDWGTTQEFFIFMNNLWGPFTIDRFASHTNTKLARFNSVFWNPGSENVDCFSVNWANDKLVGATYFVSWKMHFISS